jgi:hypothetical protein
MLKKILLLLWAVLILLIGNPNNGSADSDRTAVENADLSTLQFKRIAVMPFLVGKLESPEQPVEVSMTTRQRREIVRVNSVPPKRINYFLI